MDTISLGFARLRLAEYAGHRGNCSSSEETRQFVMEVLERVLKKGARENLRKWCFNVSNACFTAPSNLEVPLAVKVNGRLEGVFSEWRPFSDAANFSDFSECNKSITREPQDYFTVYDLSVPSTLTTHSLSPEPKPVYITIQGEDAFGRQIYSEWDGQQIHGVKLEIKHRETYRTTQRFTKITGVVKDQTVGHVRLDWYLPETNKQGLLSEYSPVETRPRYRRYRIANMDCNSCYAVEVLGRVRHIDYYDDNDILPVNSISLLLAQARTMKAESNDNVVLAQFHKRTSEELTAEHNEYTTKKDLTFDIAYEHSPGSIKNII